MPTEPPNESLTSPASLVNLISIAIGFLSFAFTLLTFFNVFWASLGTFYAAGQEISDHLSSLKQGLLEERRHLKSMCRRLEIGTGIGKEGGEFEFEGRGVGNGGGYGYGYGFSYKRERSRSRVRARSTDVYGAGGRAGSRKRRESRSRGRRGWKGGMKYNGPVAFEKGGEINSMASSAEAVSLSVMRHVLRDMIREFRALEYPFLRPEYQSLDLAHWASHHHHHHHHKHDRTQYHPEKSPYYSLYNHTRSPDNEDDDDDESAVLYRTTRFGTEYRKTGLLERWKWINTKKDVAKLNGSLNRIEIRRTAHEVGDVSAQVRNLARGLDDVRGLVVRLEGRVGRPLGVGVGGGGYTVVGRKVE